MPQVSLVRILKRVSRSFYLSIRILPKSMRAPISIAYLLARAADSITDSDNIPLNRRTQYLEDLINGLSSNSNVKPKSMSKELESLLDDIDEQTLVAQLPEIIIIFHQLEKNDKILIRNVVNTLTQGMKKDLSAFSQRSQIIALDNPEALAEYTYLVAGCVGEFWTKVAINHLPSVSHWDMQKQVQLGIEFGKALQLTNILRDIAKDARLGRCYLPETILKEHQLSTKLLMDKSNDELFRPIIRQHILLTLTHFESAEAYLLSTPRMNIRLRLASIWPIIIGLETLSLLAGKKNFLDINKQIKVSRKWVYSMLLRSLLVVGSNFLLKHWLSHLKRKLQYNLQCQS